MDVSIGSTQDFLHDFVTSFWGIVLFTCIVSISIFVQISILEMVKTKTRSNNQDKYAKHHTITKIIQYLLIAITISILLQISVYSNYFTDLLAVVNTISYGLTMYLMGVISYKFLSWFTIHRTLIVLLYGIASIFIVINAFDTIILFDYLIIGKDDLVNANSIADYQQFEEDVPMTPLESLMVNTMVFTQTAYFLLLWAATVLVLYYNIKRIGKIKFWILVITPIIFFMSSYLSFYDDITSAEAEQPLPSQIVLILIFVVIYSMIIAGVFFGMGFLSIGRYLQIKKNNQSDIKDFLYISGFAFMLFIMCSISVIFQAGYPPYGIQAVSIVGMSSFLILVGLYKSATTIATDSELRRLIKNSAKDFEFLSHIGSSEMQEKIEKKVLFIMNQSEELTKNTGIEYSMNKEEIRDQVNQTIEELIKRKRKHE